MILQSLVQYYEALEQKGEITSPGWCTTKCSYALELSLDGQLKRIFFERRERKSEELRKMEGYQKNL